MRQLGPEGFGGLSKVRVSKKSCDLISGYPPTRVCTSVGVEATDSILNFCLILYLDRFISKKYFSYSCGSKLFVHGL